MLKNYYFQESKILKLEATSDAKKLQLDIIFYALHDGKKIGPKFGYVVKCFF